MLRRRNPINVDNAMSPFKPGAAGMPDITAEYIPPNGYKPTQINSGRQLDVTDPFAKMRPEQIPVPGSSMWVNPNSKLGSAYDMMGLISSFDNRQRETVNPLELYACQNEGPSVLHPEVQPIYEGCRRLILNGKQDVGFCQYKNKVVNFGRLFLDKDGYLFPYPFKGYKKNEIAVLIVKYRAPNIIMMLEPFIEFNEEMFGIGQLCRSHAVVTNYFWIAWAYMKNKDDQIFDIKAIQG